MKGSDDSKKRWFSNFGELLAMGATEEGGDVDKERETMEFPPGTAAKAVAPIISDSREMQTMPPPPNLEADPMASIKYFQQIDDESSGEADRITACRKRLQKVWLAISNRELRPEKSFIRSVFLMPFPAADRQEAKIEVYAFDHDETCSPLDEISGGLMSLTGYKDENTRKNLSREERLNLIKAFTEYYEDLPIVSPGAQEVDLKVDYLSAMEAVHRLNFQLARDCGYLPRFRLGRDIVVISPDLLAFFKKKITKYFLDKHRRSKEARGVAEEIRAIRSGIRTLNVDPMAQNFAPTEREKRISLAELKIRNLQIISRDILQTITVDGSILDLLRAMVIVEELTKTDAINIEEYIELFELNDETEARVLAKKVAHARVDISKMNLPREVFYLLMEEFLTKTTPTIRSDVWEKMIMAEA